MDYNRAGPQYMAAAGTIAQNRAQRHWFMVVDADFDAGDWFGTASPNHAGSPTWRGGEAKPDLLSSQVAHHYGTGAGFGTGPMLVEVAWDTTAHTIKWYKAHAQFGGTNTETFTFTSTSTVQWVGGAFNAPNYFDGSFGELIVCDQIITGADLTSLYAYMTTKWGL